jgi:hypothetical protein
MVARFFVEWPLEAGDIRSPFHPYTIQLSTLGSNPPFCPRRHTGIE